MTGQISALYIIQYIMCIYITIIIKAVLISSSLQHISHTNLNRPAAQLLDTPLNWF